LNLKILTAISGGVDSAVVTALLKKRGHEIIGVHMKFWHEDFQPVGSKLPENKCCSVSASEAARSVAEKLQIPFYVLNFRDDFKKKVVDYFLKTYEKNKTPNPCAICNREIKFGKLIKKMRELDCDKIATGHYARVRGNKFMRGLDTEKDQSYFLSRIASENLKNIIFPLGNMQKSEVREFAKNFGFANINKKKESQGTCFFPEKEPREFLKRNLPKKFLCSGNIRTRDGKIVGEHQGLPLYTIGQRRGVELGGMPEPYFVAGFDMNNNELIVAPDCELFSRTLRAEKLNWFGDVPVDGSRLLVQVRYGSEAASAGIFFKKSFLQVVFDVPQRAITAGQVVVFYRGKVCVGSGEII
jgi:tRNA-uridine 2-sulfurtransferase